MNPMATNHKFFIVNINEENHTYSIEETDQKPKSHHLAIETLKNMEKVINNKFKYAEVNPNDKYSKLDENARLDLFKNKALTIESRYMKAASDCNWLYRFLFSYEKEVHQIRQKIMELTFTPLPQDVLGEIGKYLTTSELTDLGRANEYLKTTTEQAFIHSAQELGYTGTNFKEANEYLKNLFTELDSLIEKKQIPNKYVVKKAIKEKSDGTTSQVIDREATLEGLSKLDPVEIEKLLTLSLNKGNDVFLKFFTNKEILDPVRMQIIASSAPTPLLHTFSTMGNFNLKAIEILLRHGADVNVQNKDLETPLHSLLRDHWIGDDRFSETNLPTYLLEEKNFDTKLTILKYLLEKGADPFIVDKNGLFAFQHAIDCSSEDTLVFYSSLSALKLIFSDREKINKQTPDGDTVLHFIFKEIVQLALAYEYLISPAIKYLLEQGADVTIKNNKGETPYDFLNDLTEGQKKKFQKSYMTFEISSQIKELLNETISKKTEDR